jgi:septal ring factor EnvC (AmiA/AmiB activator)
MLKSFRFKIILLILFIGTISILFISLAKADDIDTQIEKKQKELEDVKKEIQLSEKELRDKQEKERKLLQELEITENRLEQAIRNLNDIADQITRVRDEAEVIRGKLEDAEAKLQRREEILKTRLREVYKHRTVSYIGVILKADSFSDFINRYRYLKLVLEHDSELVEDVMLEKKHWSDSKAELEAKEKELLALQGIYEELERMVTILQQEAEERRKDEAKRDAGNGGKVVVPKLPSKSPSVLMWPVKGKVVKRFGKYKDVKYGTITFNKGLDIEASEGTKVVSAADGIVLYNKTIPYTGYGQIIMIEHGGGLVTVYAHLLSVAVEINQEVKKGEIIGRVGSTGYTAKPKLHFEVRVRGTAVDPMKYL